MESTKSLVEKLKYNEAMLHAYDGHDKEVRETLRINIRTIREELERRGHIDSPGHN